MTIPALPLRMFLFDKDDPKLSQWKPEPGESTARSKPKPGKNDKYEIDHLQVGGDLRSD